MKMLLFEMYEFQVVNLLGGVSPFVIVFLDEFKHFIIFQKNLFDFVILQLNYLP